ncbi:hypothetical protein BX070DRAFT_222352, partial [Coemansia spiralis]
MPFYQDTMSKTAEPALAPSRRGYYAPRRSTRSVVHIEVQPTRRIASADSTAIASTNSGTNPNSNSASAASTAASTACTNVTGGASVDSSRYTANDGISGSSSSTGIHNERGARPRSIWLPSDVIDAIADAAISAAVSNCAARKLSHAWLGIAPAMADEAQSVLRTMSQVCRDWRRALLVRAWQSVHLSGTACPGVADLHAFAGICAKRLVVPWGAMAAPVSWMSSNSSSYSDKTSDDTDADPDGADTDSTAEYSVAYSFDSSNRFLRFEEKAGCLDSLTSASTSACRLRCVFGDQAWPAVEHLDMSFMPLICYQGFAAHIQRIMPRLRSLRVSGFVPATALSEILDSSRLPLAALEIAGSVWANTDSGRRSSMSSWRSSLTTVAAPDLTTSDSYRQAEDVLAAETEAGSTNAPGSPRNRFSDYPNQTLPPAPGIPQTLQSLQTPPPLALLAVTADALRSPTVFAYAMAQAPTLAALHLIECDYKIMDMLRLGRMEERHMHAVEWGATPMLLHHQINNNGNGDQQQNAHVRNRPHRTGRARPVLWLALRQLHIERFYMSPREHTGLCIHADCMPYLQELCIGSMEPSDSHHPAPSPDDAMHVPQLHGTFRHLEKINAPLLDISSLPIKAPALRTLSITCISGPLARMMAPPASAVDELLKSNLPLRSV